METYNYILTSDGELYHYGVKGMKWGVRRYQNPDGSLTAKGKKRLAKNEAYRDKLVKKSQKRIDRYNQWESEAKANIDDLKKYGKNSATYKRWKDEEYVKRESDYEERNKIKGPDGTEYVKRYSKSGKKIIDDIFDGFLADTKVQDLIKANDEDAKMFRGYAEQMTKTKSNLMNMDISALTKKSEIRRTYWS